MSQPELLDHFEALHASSDDPWSVTTSWYERRKRQLTMASLPAERYRSGYEPGCSVGALTELLASRCAALLASDGAASAVERCTRRMAHQPSVRVEQRILPQEWPEGRFDLVVLSELAYYLDEADLRRTVDSAITSLEAGGTLVAVHWRQQADDFRTTGAHAHAQLGARDELGRHAGYRDADFLLDVFVRRR